MYKGINGRDGRVMATVVHLSEIYLVLAHSQIQYLINSNVCLIILEDLWCLILPELTESESSKWGREINTLKIKFLLSQHSGMLLCETRESNSGLIRQI